MHSQYEVALGNITVYDKSVYFNTDLNSL